MGKKYAVLKQITDLLEDYEAENKYADVVDFARWIVNKFQEEPDIQERMVNKTSSSPLSKAFFDERTRFLEATSSVARYHEFYVRKALKDMVINTRLEFLFLQSVNMLEKAKKTDLINMYHLEYTTGMDTIRRLINNGLLYEVQDESDKRAKLLIISDHGRAVYEESKKRLNDENKMFFTAISDNKWKKALPLLEEIDGFHSDIYRKHSDKSFAELSNLMDSLKHLLK